MKKVMVRAWEIAKEAVKNFGGKVKEYFRQALIMAWEEVKGAVNMVALKGSEKQIAWAESIRKEIIEAIKNKDLSTWFYAEMYLTETHSMTAEQMRALGSKEEMITIAERKRAAAIEMLSNLEDAKIWIEKRNMKPSYFARIARNA